jgi:ribosomal protein S27AE
MDKYSVVLEDEEESKTSGDKSVCPKCGLPLGENIEVNGRKFSYCSRCGTEPFEAKPNG